MNKLRNFFYSNGAPQCHQSSRKVPDKGQVLLGTVFSVSGLLQPAVMIKLSMFGGRAPLAGQNLQHPISQLTGASARQPPPGSRALTESDFRFSGNRSDRAERETTLKQARSNWRANERDSDSYCGRE
jgi:hypothetical protein